MPAVGWSEGLGRPVIQKPGDLPIVSADETVRRMDQDGDGLVSPQEKQLALDTFAPGKEADHKVAVARVKQAEAQLDSAKKDLEAKAKTAKAWNTTGNVGMIGTAAASVGIFLATELPVLAAIPVLNVIAIVLAGLFGLLALVAKIGQVVADGKEDKAKVALEEARAAQDRAFQELGATLPRMTEAVVPDAAPARTQLPPPTTMRGASLRRVA